MYLGLGPCDGFYTRHKQGEWDLVESIDGKNKGHSAVPGLEIGAIASFYRKTFWSVVWRVL